MPRYDLDPIEPPALPIAPTEYNQGERDRFSNVLRLYFNRIASFVRSLIGTAGGRFLDFPNGSFSDDRDYMVGSTDVAAPIRFNTNYLSNGLSVISESISQNDFGSNLFATVDDGAGGSGNILTITVAIISVDIYVGMEVTMAGLPAGTYVIQKNSVDQFLISTSALISSPTLVSFTGTSKVQVSYPGRYNFQFSVQMVNTVNDTSIISIWWRKNGVNIADSNSDFGLSPRKSAGTPSRIIGSMNFFIDLEQDDYVQLIWRADDIGASIEHFDAVPAGVGTPAIPATPSVIFTGSFVSRLVNS